MTSQITLLFAPNSVVGVEFGWIHHHPSSAFGSVDRITFECLEQLDTTTRCDIPDDESLCVVFFP